jgi:hypothetical protein
LGVLVLTKKSDNRSKKQKRPFSAFTLVAIGIALLIWGGQYVSLLLWGQWQKGVINYSVRQFGSARGGTVYKVHYAFQVPGQSGSYRGTASTGRNNPPAGRVPIRYLRFWPDINHPGTNSLLIFYSIISMFPGLLLAWFSLRTLKKFYSIRTPS